MKSARQLAAHWAGMDCGTLQGTAGARHPAWVMPHRRRHPKLHQPEHEHTKTQGGKERSA